MILARESWIENKCLELDITYTVNELADKLSINRKTVMRALQQLEDAKLIYAHRTSGKPTVYALYDPNIRR
jgi:DNA-binding transcriptional regulator YhcF (GntR family)